MNYDIYLVGVGGQGVLTIGELLAEAALRRDLPVNFFPSRGMAQRGGFVKAQLRLGRETSGPNISECGANLAIATEQSEALKAIPFVRPGGDFLLFADVWAPTAVMLGKAAYPSLEAVCQAISAGGARLWLVEPAALPVYQCEPVPANLFLLGVCLRRSTLGQLFTPDEIHRAIEAHWPRGAQANQVAFEMGFTYETQMRETVA